MCFFSVPTIFIYLVVQIHSLSQFSFNQRGIYTENAKFLQFCLTNILATLLLLRNLVIITPWSPKLVSKCSVVQKISFRQTFTDILNLCCDLDLENSNPIFCTTLAYDAVLSNQVWLQTNQKFRK